jgi:hypothetical protein
MNEKKLFGCVLGGEFLRAHGGFKQKLHTPNGFFESKELYSNEPDAFV